MQTININDIAGNQSNPRATQFTIGALAKEVKTPTSSITVREIPAGGRGPHYEVIDGMMRLKVQLDLYGRAIVRMYGSGEQIHVRLDARGNLVRIQQFIGTFYTFDGTGKCIGNASAGGNAHARRKAKRSLERNGFTVKIAEENF